jgi:hypothetical protein
VKHLLLIVARVEYSRDGVQLTVVALGELSLLRCDVEFLILIESQTRCMRGLELFCEQTLHDKYIVGLHTLDAARPFHLTGHSDVLL